MCLYLVSCHPALLFIFLFFALKKRVFVMNQCATLAVFIYIYYCCSYESVCGNTSRSIDDRCLFPSEASGACAAHSLCRCLRQWRSPQPLWLPTTRGNNRQCASLLSARVQRTVHHSFLKSACTGSYIINWTGGVVTVNTQRGTYRLSLAPKANLQRFVILLTYITNWTAEHGEYPKWNVPFITRS